jgi:hypothetical protein
MLNCYKPYLLTQDLLLHTHCLIYTWVVWRWQHLSEWVHPWSFLKADWVFSLTTWDRMLCSFPSIAWLAQILLQSSAPTQTLINHIDTHHGEHMYRHTIQQWYIHSHSFSFLYILILPTSTISTYRYVPTFSHFTLASWKGLLGPHSSDGYNCWFFFNVKSNVLSPNLGLFNHSTSRQISFGDTVLLKRPRKRWSTN